MSGDISIQIEIFGITKLEGYIDRIFAPITADAILDKIPFVMRGRWSFGSKKYWTLPGLGLSKGTNPKSKKQIEKGELVYNPKTDEIIIAIQDVEFPNKVNKVGKVKIKDEILNARNGLNTKVLKA